MDHQAFAQLLGNYGEFVGAIAVVATLIYLAIQVKHSKESLDANTKALRGQAMSDITRNVHDQMHMMIQGHDIAAMFNKFATEEKLDSQEAFLLDSVLSAVFMARQNEFLQWRMGLLDDEVFASLHHIILTILSSPNGQHWWENEGRRMFAQGFVDFVDDLARDGTSDSFQAWKKAIRLGDD